jgi:hypothetical protein
MKLALLAAVKPFIYVVLTPQSHPADQQKASKSCANTHIVLAGDAPCVAAGIF